MDNLARSYQIEQELRGTIDMQDDIICKLVALNERLKAALAVADAGDDCRYCQHRNCMDDEPYRDACNAHSLDCSKCPTPCYCGKCEHGSMWALDLEKLPEVRK